MTRDEYEEAKHQSAEISILLRSGDLTPDERARLEELQARLSGILLSTWLPFGWRRVAMIALLLIGVLGVAAGNLYFLIAWVVAFCFSPRIIGECAYLFGGLSSKSDR